MDARAVWSEKEPTFCKLYKTSDKGFFGKLRPVDWRDPGNAESAHGNFLISVIHSLVTVVKVCG